MCHALQNYKTQSNAFDVQASAAQAHTTMSQEPPTPPSAKHANLAHVDHWDQPPYFDRLSAGL